MPITIAGSGTITGISAGGLPDDSIIAADIAAGAVTTAKVADANITAAKLDGAQSGSAPIYGARAWVNFNGTGVVAIRASGNVSSITDNGTGNYTVNFTTALTDANYCSVLTTSADAVAASYLYEANSGANRSNATTTTLSIQVVNNSAAAADRASISVAIFR